MSPIDVSSSPLRMPQTFSFANPDLISANDDTETGRTLSIPTGGRDVLSKISDGRTRNDWSCVSGNSRPRFRTIGSRREAAYSTIHSGIEDPIDEYRQVSLQDFQLTHPFTNSEQVSTDFANLQSDRSRVPSPSALTELTLHVLHSSSHPFEARTA